MKIFWSWQSDTPPQIGRFLIRDALNLIVKELKADLAIDEPVRRQLNLDYDRKGVPGSPDLANTILRKIRESAVFVADVTPVGVTKDDKKLMNPNVAIELGYALEYVGDNGLLMILNTAYGDRDSLPFDLRHKAGPIMFELKEDATKTELEEVKAELVAQLKGAIRASLRAAGGRKKRNVKGPELKFCFANKNRTDLITDSSMRIETSRFPPSNRVFGRKLTSNEIIYTAIQKALLDPAVRLAVRNTSSTPARGVQLELVITSSSLGLLILTARQFNEGHKKENYQIENSLSPWVLRADLKTIQPKATKHIDEFYIESSEAGEVNLAATLYASNLAEPCTENLKIKVEYKPNDVSS